MGVNIKDGNFKVVDRRENTDNHIFSTKNKSLYQGLTITNDGALDITLKLKKAGIQVFDDITVKGGEIYFNFFEFDRLEITANGQNYRIEVFQ